MNNISDSANGQFLFGCIPLIVLSSGPLVALGDLVELVQSFVVSSSMLIARNHFLIERRKDTVDENGVELYKMKSNPIFRTYIIEKATFNKTARPAADSLSPASQKR